MDMYLWVGEKASPKILKELMGIESFEEVDLLTVSSSDFKTVTGIK